MTWLIPLLETRKAGVLKNCHRPQKQLEDKKNCGLGLDGLAFAPNTPGLGVGLNVYITLASSRLE